MNIPPYAAVEHHQFILAPWGFASTYIAIYSETMSESERVIEMERIRCEVTVVLIKCTYRIHLSQSVRKLNIFTRVFLQVSISATGFLFWRVCFHYCYHFFHIVSVFLSPSFSRFHFIFDYVLESLDAFENPCALCKVHYQLYIWFSYGWRVDR